MSVAPECDLIILRRAASGIHDGKAIVRDYFQFSHLCAAAGKGVNATPMAITATASFESCIGILDRRRELRETFARQIDRELNILGVIQVRRENLVGNTLAQEH